MVAILTMIVRHTDIIALQYITLNDQAENYNKVIIKTLNDGLENFMRKYLAFLLHEVTDDL